MGNGSNVGKIDRKIGKDRDKMKVVQINATCGAGSTGKICVAVSELLTQAGVENYILYTSGNSSHPVGKKYMSAIEVKMQALKSRVFGNYGFQSKAATKRLIAELDLIAPDIIHLHNLHSHNVNLGMLFAYLKDKYIKTYWTFHDCWAFTGYCPHYDMIGCDRWKMGCGNCPQRSHYSCFFDCSHTVYEKKKRLLQGVALTIITPSRWLADQVKQSFLKDCHVKVINNGIDLSVFRLRESDFRKRYNIEDKFVILGVAFDWGIRKGLDVFVDLSRRLDEEFQIVLVGTDDTIDRQLPSNIISIHRTANQTELAEIYTAADLFVNPTREENFPTVNIESLACGTPVLTFRTGGSPEILDDLTGMVVDRNDEEALYNAIIKIENERPFSAENCCTRAKEFDELDRFREYVALYEGALD